MESHYQNVSHRPMFVTKDIIFNGFVFSECHVHVRYMLSPVRLSSVCLLVTLVHRTQAVVIFGNILRRLVRWPSTDMHEKFYRDLQRGTPPSGELNTRGVAKYSDF